MKFSSPALLLPSLLGVISCHDWDFYDPRLGDAGGSSPTSTTSTGGAAQVGGAGGEAEIGGSGGVAQGAGGSATDGGGGGGPTGCGNGSIGAGEECDDGGTESGDGCSADCIVECSGNKDPTTFHCYLVQTTMASWDAAHAGCLALGAGWELAAINSIAERDWVDTEDLVSVSFTWIGGRDATEGVYTWSNGEPFSAEASSLLSNITGSPEDCLAYQRVSGLTNDAITDGSCNTQYPSMCELTPAGS